PRSREGLKNLLTQYCEGVMVVGMGEDVPTGVAEIIRHRPDVVFLDIELPVQSGFELFNYFPTRNFEVVFTTAYDQYAVRAFRLSAADYLLKPIDLEELREALRKVRERRTRGEQLSNLEILRKNLSHEQATHVALPTQEGFEFCLAEDITRCEADGNYTHIYLKEGEHVLVCRTLKEFDELLQGQRFFRAHRSHLINLRFVRKYTRAKAPVITMHDGSQVTLSSGKRESFLEQMLKN
ncbi:MAG: LytTR family DNA-binding domain-containing protein, partial [Bacteroidota bacterium]